MQIRNCEIVFFELGVACIGSADSSVDWLELSGNLIRGLQPKNGNALMFENSVSNLAVRHNRFTQVRTALNIVGRWSSVEVANNTFFRTNECIGPAAEPVSQSVRIAANLAVECETFVTRLTPVAGSVSFELNKSDSAGADGSSAESIGTITFRSTDFADSEFLRPLPNDQLKISSAPNYVGAIEPQS